MVSELPPWAARRTPRPAVLAQITGWIASDAGRPEEAARVYRLGISAAQEAGGGTLESNLLGSLAYQITNIGDPNEGVTSACAAVEALGPMRQRGRVPSLGIEWHGRT